MIVTKRGDKSPGNPVFGNANEYSHRESDIKKIKGR